MSVSIIKEFSQTFSGWVHEPNLTSNFFYSFKGAVLQLLALFERPFTEHFSGFRYLVSKPKMPFLLFSHWTSDMT